MRNVGFLRSAIVIFAGSLGACASGGAPGADVDAGPGTDGTRPPDAALCGEPGQLPCDGIHVAKSGSDSAAGSKTAPLKTIAAGIAKAGATGQKTVFVKYGVYDEQITMSPGVTVIGGFDDAWARNPGVDTEIRGPSPVVTFDAITVPTVLDGVIVKAADATGPGASSVAVVVRGSQMIELVDVTVEAGVAAPGSAGSNGSISSNGVAGQAGKPGCEDSGGLCSSCSIPAGGTGGGSPCGRDGGRGGTPGHENGSGAPGSPGAGGTPGGAGGGASGNGTAGGTGAAGAAGTNGSGGASVGTFEGATYLPAGGGNGTPGADGNGGGGGGGGGGGATDCDSYGSSGGGGGSGGCGGGAAFGGTGGGGSFGVIAVDSSLVLRSSTVVASRGGDGGSGGSGGAGGAGGTGGAGGPYGGSGEQDDGGFGGRGGNGGNGGRGGHGGGGGGGPSAAVVCVGAATITIPQSMLVGGTPGNGGASVGNPGAQGTSTNAIGCSFF